MHALDAVTSHLRRSTEQRTQISLNYWQDLETLPLILSVLDIKAGIWRVLSMTQNNENNLQTCSRKCFGK
jgi:hypothetical protein